MANKQKVAKTVGGVFKVGDIGDTAGTGNQIEVSAYVVGGSSAVAGYIVKQVGARRFKITTAQGTSICKLTTGSVTEGLCSITATREDTITFLISKLSKNRVTGADGVLYTWGFTGALQAALPLPKVTLAAS